MNWLLQGRQEGKVGGGHGAPGSDLFPEVIESSLEEGFAVCCAFDPAGLLLATGCSDATIVLWDFAVRRLAACFLGHVGVVTSLSWNSTGERLASGSADWQVIVWDVATGKRIFQQSFGAPVLTVQFHPANSNLLLVCCLLKPPLLIDCDSHERISLANALTSIATKYGSVESPGGESPSMSASHGTAQHSQSPCKTTPAKRLRTDLSADQSECSTQVCVGETNNQSDGEKARSLSANASSAPINTVAAFRPSGDMIFFDTGTGAVAALNTHDLTPTSICLPIGSGVRVKSMSFSTMRESGSFLLVNSTDRSLRIIDTQTGGLVQTMQDKVSRVSWKCCALTANAQFVVAGPTGPNEHHLFIWEVGTGMLVKVLEGPPEGVLDVAWHPTHPEAASVSTAGIVYVWVARQQNLWSTFEPTFTELEANEEYLEREDEFDEDCSASEPTQSDLIGQEDTDVDVITVESSDLISRNDMQPPPVIGLDGEAKSLVEVADAVQAVGRAYVEALKSKKEVR